MCAVQRKAKIMLLLLAFFCQIAFAVPEIEQAAAHNMGLASKLLGAQNACGAEERQASADNPFTVSDLKIVALMPQADNVSSDLSNVSLLWSWSASYPLEASFALPSSGECSNGEYRISNPSAPGFEGTLAYRYGNVRTEMPLRAGGPNPVLLDLNETRLGSADFASAPYANLSAIVSGIVSVTYGYRETRYAYSCVNTAGGEICGCEAHYSAGQRRYGVWMEDGRTFGIETGKVSELWLNPPLQKRLEGNERAEVLFFARRMPAKISTEAGGRALGGSSPYLFSVHEGECGAEEVVSSFYPNGTVQISMSGKPLVPLQLVANNHAYLPFYASFEWNETSGRKTAVLYYEDWFSHNWSYARNFSVRSPAPFGGSAAGGAEGTAMEYRRGDDYRAPAAYPSHEKDGKLPDISVFAAIAAIPFVLGAYAALRFFADAGEQ